MVSKPLAAGVLVGVEMRVLLQEVEVVLPEVRRGSLEVQMGAVQGGRALELEEPWVSEVDKEMKF